MNPHTIKRLFPNASKSLLAANAQDYGTGDDSGEVSRPKPKHAILSESLGNPENQKGHSVRFLVRITSYRRTLADLDNLCGKFHLDCCRFAKLIPDDTPEIIDYQITQTKVATKAEERTEIEITPP